MPFVPGKVGGAPENVEDATVLMGSPYVTQPVVEFLRIDASQVFDPFYAKIPQVLCDARPHARYAFKTAFRFYPVSSSYFHRRKSPLYAAATAS